MTFWAKQFKDEDTPLNDEQARQLTTIFLEEHRRAQREAVSNVWPSEPHVQLAHMEEQLKLHEERLGRIHTAAQSFLSPEQLAKLRDGATPVLERRRSNVNSWREAVQRGKTIEYQPPLMFIEQRR